MNTCPSCGMDSCDCDEGTWNPPAQTSTYTCGVCGVSMQMEQPAQRPWVNATTWRGLTDEEALEVMRQVPQLTVEGLLSVEAKLKEKNT